MGTDITLFVEVRKSKDEPWQKLGKQFPYPYYKPEQESLTDPDGYEWNPQFSDQPYHGHNYDLFAVLADVRNGRGFAGAVTGERIKPISEPRGMPDDLSPEMRKIAEEEFYHSSSWLMLREVLDYNWDVPKVNTGVLRAGQYEALKRGVNPQYWSSAVSGPGSTTYSAVEYEAGLADGSIVVVEEKSKGDVLFVRSNTYVHTNWLQEGGLRASIDDEWFRMTSGLADAYGPDNCRLVFGFDS
jgi:hypothetical protein